MAESALLIQLRPRYQQEREKRVYSEKHLKQLMFLFARDIGCKWSDKKLKAFIDEQFEF